MAFSITGAFLHKYLSNPARPSNYFQLQPKTDGVNFDPSTISAASSVMSSDDEDLTEEEWRELRARRRAKTGPGTTRSGRKER